MSNISVSGIILSMLSRNAMASPLLAVSLASPFPGRTSGLPRFTGVIYALCRPSTRALSPNSKFCLGLMARMIAVDREYVVNKYKLHKLKDIEGMFSELHLLELHGCDD